MTNSIYIKKKRVIEKTRPHDNDSWQILHFFKADRAILRCGGISIDDYSRSGRKPSKKHYIDIYSQVNHVTFAIV